MRKHPLAECESCPLYKERIAPTSGPEGAKVAVVSRSPGTYDVRAKKPFSGPSGKVLNHLLELNEVKREDVLVTNVVLCYCDSTPPKEAVASCRARLHHDLRNADTVIAAGSEAVSELTNYRSLDGTRGFAHERRTAEGKLQRVISTYNPAIVWRDDKYFPNLVRDFKLALNPLPNPELPEVRWTNNVSEAERLFKAILNERIEMVTVDIEARGLRADADFVALGLSASGSKAISFGERPLADSSFISRYVRRLLESGRSRSLYHNGKFDVRNLRRHGIAARVDEDTMLLSWALDERSDEQQVHSLDYLLMNELNWPRYEPDEVKEWKRRVSLLERQLRFNELRKLPTPDSLYEYNALDAAGTAQLFPILKARAIEDGVWEKPYRSHLIPASETLVEIELTGMNYDTEAACDMLEEEVWPKLENWREELRLIVGDGSYNPNSADQNAKLVYDKWGVIHQLPLKKERTVDKSVYTEIKAGRFNLGSLDERVLERSAVDERRRTAIRWADRLAEFKALDKQRSTYLEGLIPRAIHDNGRVFTNFKFNTVTGRLSSSGPNLQNITRTKAGLPNIRRLFVAGENRSLLQADYSQAELRCIAVLAGDKELTRIYLEGLDLHDIAAERFYGADFSKEQRARAKNMDFGVPYGQSAETFQEKHDIPKAEGEKFIKWWFTQFSDVDEWRKEVARRVETEGEVVSPFGHKRRFHLLTDANKNAAFREGINFLPQNIAAMFTLDSCIQAAKAFVDSSAQIILTVHDSIIVECLDDDVDCVANELTRIMVGAPERTIGWVFPFEVDVQIGQNWGELHDLPVNGNGEGIGVASPGSRSLDESAGRV